MSALKPALLALADGSIFKGVSVGYDGQTVAEVVFNTAMSGYQEIMTDPSYRQQIVTFTCPHIGNVGTNPDDAESDRVHVAGLVIREVPRKHSNFRSTQDFRDYLIANKVVTIAEVDTRRLTRVLRDKGAQAGCIMAGDHIDTEHAIAQARAHGGLQGVDLAQVVSTAQPYPWTQGSWDPVSNQSAHSDGSGRFHVVVFDFGIKRNMLRMLVDRGCRVTVVPAKTTAAEVLALQPDGVMLSNGPGDPEPCDYAITMVRELLQKKLPLFGICLGHQILGLALGAKTMKMKFGHHGTNHPVQNLATRQVLITAQNHGFAIDESSLPAGVETTHRSLFDGSNQGLRVLDAPAFSFQGHPEASSGPHDVSELFDQFIASMA